MPGLLAFHAHPDDETLSMGGTLATYAAGGEHVVVVTGTRGEAGEIHNREDADEIRERLGEVREEELAQALKVLGVEHHHFLGYRDSGMMGTPENGHDDCFWRADFMEATGRLVSQIRKHQPEVVTAYDPFGGYGHPDHIQVHRVGTAAYFGAADVGRFPLGDGEEPWQPSKLYWATWPRERMRAMRRLMLEAGEITQEEAAAEPTAGTRDEDISMQIDVSEHFEKKREALYLHVTQIPADSWFRTLPEEQMRKAFGRESFMLAHSRVDAPASTPDLFAGLR